MKVPGEVVRSRGLSLILFFALLLLSSNAWSVGCGEDANNRQNGFPTIYQLGLGRGEDLPTAEQAAARDQIIERHHPYAAEVCSSSKAAREGSGIKGLDFDGTEKGHEFYFLKGVCTDPNAAYPRLIKCSALPKCKSVVMMRGCNLSDPADPDAGVGISVDNVFANVNWVAIQGRKTFFDGASDAHLAKYGSLSAVEQAYPDFKGVKLNNQAPPAPTGQGSDYQGWAASLALGTDYGIRRARNIQCLRTYMPESAIQTVIDEFNKKNEAAQKNGFHYNGLTNNCATLGRDVFEKVGFVNTPVDKSNQDNLKMISKAGQLAKSMGLQSLLNWIDPDAAKVNPKDLQGKIAIPTNELHHMESTQLTSLPGPMTVFDDPVLKDALSSFGEIPAEDLASVHVYGQKGREYFGFKEAPMPKAEDGTIYHDRFYPQDMVLLLPFISMDAVKNKLLNFQGLKGLLAGESAESFIGGHAELKKDPARAQDFRRFYAQYSRWIDNSIASLQSDLKALEESDRALSRCDERSTPALAKRHAPNPIGGESTFRAPANQGD